MKNFRTRLLLILMAMIGISMLAAGLTMGGVYKKSHILGLEENMAREINLLESTFQFLPIDDAGAVAFYREQAVKISESIDARVTFVLKDGTVLGDSESQSTQMDNHLNREEIRTAKESGVGYAIRFSDTLGRDMLYVAEPVTADGYDGYIRLSMSLEAVDEGLDNGWKLMSMTMVILFIAAVVISYPIASGITSPLEKITRVARRISRLDYHARVEIKRGDEIGQLAVAINGMADSLEKQMKTIQDNENLLQSVLDNMTGGILMVNAHGTIVLLNPAAELMLGVKNNKVTGKSFSVLRQHYELSKVITEGIDKQESVHEERMIYQAGREKIVRVDGVPMSQGSGDYQGMLFLLQDITAIRNLEKMRSEFVANVSHELKTPVAAVKGFAETLLGGGVEDEKTARSFLQIIYDESERLNRLISDILDLSSIESKRVTMDFAPIHLTVFISSILDTIQTVADKKQISLQADVPDELFMEADEDKLRQIVMNLLSNAINYTLEGGHVRVTAQYGQSHDEAEYVIIRVTDTGIGIPKKDLPRIFERFYRVDKARSRSSGGTGLGLSIVKHLVDMHHGTISVESELGAGTTFMIELPVLHEDS